MKKSIKLFALFLIVTLVSGCGMSSKEIKTKDGSVKLSNDGVEVKSQDGNSQLSIGGEKGLDLPEGYPEDIIPVIDGSKINLANRSEDQNKKIAYSIVYVTNKSFEEVVAFYKDAVKDAQNLNQTTMGDGASFGGEKGGYSFWLVIGSDTSGDNLETSVTITVGPKSE